MGKPRKSKPKRDFSIPVPLSKYALKQQARHLETQAQVAQEAPIHQHSRPPKRSLRFQHRPQS